MCQKKKGANQGYPSQREHLSHTCNPIGWPQYKLFFSSKSLNISATKMENMTVKDNWATRLDYFRVAQWSPKASLFRLHPLCAPEALVI